MFVPLIVFINETITKIIRLTFKEIIKNQTVYLLSHFIKNHLSEHSLYKNDFKSVMHKTHLIMTKIYKLSKELFSLFAFDKHHLCSMHVAGQSVSTLRIFAGNFLQAICIIIQTDFKLYI